MTDKCNKNPMSEHIENTIKYGVSGMMIVPSGDYRGLKVANPQDIFNLPLSETNDKK